MFSRLSRRDNPFVDKRGRHEFNDVFEHTERLASLSPLFKELADDLMNGYISVNSNRLNQIMKVLTVVTVIFLPLTLLVRVYGMNFEDMPELKIKYAYFILLAVMGGIAVSLLLLFRKIRWLQPAPSDERINERVFIPGVASMNFLIWLETLPAKISTHSLQLKTHT